MRLGIEQMTACHGRRLHVFFALIIGVGERLAPKGRQNRRTESGLAVGLRVLLPGAARSPCGCTGPTFENEWSGVTRIIAGDRTGRLRERTPE